MARAPRVQQEEIQGFLTLLYIVERAMDGLMRWAYEQEDAFEPSLAAHLAATIDQQDLTPLAVAQRRLSDASRILGSQEVAAAISDSATLRAALKAASGELAAALAAAPPQPGEQEKETFHLSLYVLVKYLADQIRAQKGDKGGVRRLSVAALIEAHRVIKPIYEQRNRVMHGDLPVLLLGKSDKDEGLVVRAAALLSIARQWLQGFGGGSRELFPGCRYLELDAEDLHRILTNGRVDSYKISVDKHDLVFYRRSRLQYDIVERQFVAQRERDYWCPDAARPTTRGAAETDMSIESKARDGWLKRVRISPGPAPAYPTDAKNDLFGVPVWTHAPKKSDRSAFFLI